MDFLEEFKDVLIDPKWLVSELDKYVIGQEQAKKSIAVFILNRGLYTLKKSEELFIDDDYLLPKNNLMLLGPTGTGKTSLIRATAKILDCPITMYDVTGLTKAGYVGQDVEEIFVSHLNNSYEYFLAHPELETINTEFPNPDSKLELVQKIAESGIIYLDEIDKLRMHDSWAEQNGIGGGEIQNELLHYFDGGIVDLKNRKIKCTLPINSINTSNIFFIMGGAFDKLDKIIKRRQDSEKGMGFGATHNNLSLDDLLPLVTNEDLENYGFKYEFLGRVPIKSILLKLTDDDLKRILFNSYDSIYAKYKNLFHLFNITLKISKDAVKHIISVAKNSKVGARSLEVIFNKIMEKYLYNIYSINDGIIKICYKDIKEIVE